MLLMVFSSIKKLDDYSEKEQNKEKLLMFVTHVVVVLEDQSYSEHSGAEEAADGLGHLHEDGGLFLHRHLLRSSVQRGTS